MTDIKEKLKITITVLKNMLKRANLTMGVDVADELLWELENEGELLYSCQIPFGDNVKLKHFDSMSERFDVKVEKMSGNEFKIYAKNTETLFWLGMNIQQLLLKND